MKSMKQLFTILLLPILIFSLSACNIISQDEFNTAVKESYQEGYKQGEKDTYKVYQLNGSYECVSVYATPLQDLPATEENVFFTDDCFLDIRDGHFTMWDYYGDYSFGPAKVAPESSLYEFIVYAPSYNEYTGETIEEDIIIAYIDVIDALSFDLLYTKEGDNDYFTNIIARFEKVGE